MMENPEEILQALDQFQKLRPTEIPKELEDYLCWVAKTGEPLYQWNLIKVLFREKLSQVMNEFHESGPNLDLTPCPNVEVFNYDAMKTTLLDRLDSFSNPPFTVQRICELLTAPRKEYNRIDKFMRAIEKNILVVSTKEPNPLDRQNNDKGEGQLVNGSVDNELSPKSHNSAENEQAESWTKDSIFMHTSDSSVYPKQSSSDIETLTSAGFISTDINFPAENSSQPVQSVISIVPPSLELENEPTDAREEFRLEVSESRTFIEVQKIDSDPIIPTEYLDEKVLDCEEKGDPLLIHPVESNCNNVEEEIREEDEDSKEGTNSPEDSSSSSENSSSSEGSKPVSDEQAAETSEPSPEEFEPEAEPKTPEATETVEATETTETTNNASFGAVSVIEMIGEVKNVPNNKSTDTTETESLEVPDPKPISCEEMPLEEVVTNESMDVDSESKFEAEPMEQESAEVNNQS